MICAEAPVSVPSATLQPSAYDKSVVRLAAFSEKLLAQLGSRFAGPVSILRNWTFCLFYVMAELWGSVVVSLLFWGFANQVRQPPHCLPAFTVQTRHHASANPSA
jgi:ATP/ADP translocase